MKRPVSKAKKRLYFLLGSLSLIMAYVGVALPGVPGIPFILLTAYFYVQSSDRMYGWLLRQRFFGKVIREFQAQQTVPRKFKLLVVSQLWVSIAVAEIWFVKNIWWRAAIVVSGIVCSIVVARLKKSRPDSASPTDVFEEKRKEE
ncbi:MAG TPA: DUF454 domain-containing protein [Bacteroidetes bacterium]|nr:DUF454 domain-containing protein [Bacteroidota bacterium]